jgi:hypothetical protein
MSDAAKKSDTELSDGLGDWRYRAREFILPTNPNDTRLRVASARGAFLSSTGEAFTFNDFYAPAIYLSAAIAADKTTRELRAQIKPEERLTRTGPEMILTNDQSGILFDLLEQSAISAVFSFQALEAFCNDRISDKLEGTEGYMFALKGKPSTLMSAEDIERNVSTVDKLKKIVPDLLGIDSAKDDPLWSKFWTLKQTRDALTHLKTRDQRAAALAAAADFGRVYIDPDFVFYKLVSGKIVELPRTAVELFDYFTRNTGTPRWLRYPFSVYGITPTPPKGTTRITIGRQS